MKKFFYLMAFVCTLGFFTACSSDDDPTPTVWDTYEGGNYSVWAEDLDTEDNDLSYNILDMNMKVEKAGDNTAKVTITSNDEDATITVNVPAATISKDGETIKLSGNGTATVKDEDMQTKAQMNPNSIACSINATINGNDVKLDMTADGQTISATSEAKPATSQLLGTWYTEPTTWYDADGNKVEAGSDDATYADGSFKLTWETKEGTSIKIPLGYADMEVPAATAAALAQRMANKNFANILHAVAFTADGKILAQYAEAASEDKESTETTSPKWQIAEGYATYKIVNENKILVFVDSENALEKVTDETQKKTLTTILNLFKDGVPVNIRWSNNNKTAFFYVDKDFASSLANSPILAEIVKNLKDEDLNNYGKLIKLICSQIPGLMENTNKFEAGLELVK